MITVTLESIEQRMSAIEQEVVRLKRLHKTQSLLTGKPNSRERLLKELEKIIPISNEDVEIINKAIQEARERSNFEILPS